MQSIDGKYTQGDFDDLRLELNELEMRRSIGQKADEDRIKKLREILKREFGYE